MTTSTRPNWWDTWHAVAVCVGERSLCTRDQVGAVIVDSRNRIVATGYNGPPAGFPALGQPCSLWCQRAQAPQLGATLSTGYTDCPALHAEANALLVCDRFVREGGTIYVTSHVCMGCAKLIANSGLDAVAVKPKALSAGRVSHREPEKVYAFLEQCGISVYVS